MSRWMKLAGCCFTVGIFGLLMIGCIDGGSKATLADSIDGIWKNNAGNQKLAIHFIGENKSIALGKKVFSVILKNVNENTILINSAQEDENLKDWKIVRMWNSNGSDFSLALIHDGKREEFFPVERS